VTAGSFLMLPVVDCDLFHPASIRRMATHFETLLAEISIRREVRLEELSEILAELDTQREVSKERDLRTARLQKFETTKRRVIRQ